MADILFTLDGSATPLLGGAVALDQTRVHQQQAYDPVAGLVYATQVIANGIQLTDETEPPPTGVRDSRGDLALNRVTLDGEVTGVMYVRGFDHGAGLAVEHEDGTAYLWLAYDAEQQPIGTNAHGRRLVRMAFEDGAILDVGAPDLDVYEPISPYQDVRAITASLDADTGRMGIAYNTGSGTRYRVFGLEDFRAKDFSAPLFEFARPSFPSLQSWTLYGHYVYQFHGTAYGDANPAPPEGNGDAYWTVIDIRTGETIQRVHDLHALTLESREPESVAVWDVDGRPQFVFGFATGPVGARLMNLYAIDSSVDPDVTLTAAVVGRPQPGVELTVNLAQTAGIQDWSILRSVGDVDQLLFSGQGNTLPTGSTWLDSSPPACVPVTYKLVIQRTSGASEIDTSDAVTYTPEEGCGGGGGPVGDQTTTLGCATEYTALIHWRGGARPYTALPRLTAVSWGRTINDVSEASITVAMADVGAECCEALGLVEPWVHELTIYRDGELVWQGPVVRPKFGRNTVVIEATDVFSWLDHVVNTFRVTYTSSTADARGRMRAPITYIAENHIRLNLAESSLSVPPDWCEVLPYIVRRDTGLPRIKVEKDGSTNGTVWTEYLGTILREWTKRGLTWTTVGRSLLLRGRPTSETRAAATLTLDHIAGDVEVVKDGGNGATYAFATSQESRNISTGKTLGTGRTGTAYGRLDTLVKLQEEEVTDADLRAAARDDLAGRYPVPVSVSVPDSAQLTPDAPVTMRQLVPGERLDVFAHSLCLPLAQGFALSEVDVTWQDGAEKVGIGLIPLGDVDEELSA
ncbi:hypothetical protein [Streptomyces sulphureus]|uniref:hypothetical protein n=1 Tax=Streptomyces sulphureus TaxID=47758 RepID=UPI00036B5D08|nr:hypothetical protein [Streptomyces sulphureus]